MAGSAGEGLLDEWVDAQLAATSLRADLLDRDDLRSESEAFMQRFLRALQTGAPVEAEPWEPVREFLEELSASRARAGFSASETATFVLSFKEPVYARLLAQSDTGGELQGTLWQATVLFDSLALYTTDAFQRSRERVIRRQQNELLEVSTPAIQLWDNIIALPLIGTLDSARAQLVMETLLDRIVSSRSAIAIIDITGVPTVDTQVSQHLLKTASAVRLMGAECVISGISPQIAQTIVSLGLDMSNVVTRSSMADALAYAFDRTAQRVISTKQ